MWTVIFLENDGGCFVTKVSPDGSAARSGGVEVGDQLAAINGATCVRVTVDDICKMIAAIPESSDIELVFVRYTGPPRPVKKVREQTKTSAPKKKAVKETSAPRRTGQAKKPEQEKQKKGLGRWFGKKK
jgi:C-terminal processing protease CtpA/Prc